MTSPAGLDRHNIVVLPSISFSEAELRKITGVQFYEQRMLFMLLLLADPELRMVFVTSVPVEPEIVEYHLRFLPDPAGARERLTMFDVGDPSIRPLSEKLLGRPDVLGHMKRAAGDPDDAFLLPFTVTPAEADVADALGLVLFGAKPQQRWLGSKSGSREVAARAGVPTAEGRENIDSVKAMAAAISEIRDARPDAQAVVVKLNNGFSGQGNAVIEVTDLADPIMDTRTIFCAAEESWPMFSSKLAAEGAIVEELIRSTGLVSPSVQLRISTAGQVEVISTHDQILGGPHQHVYLGCRFPAAGDYRLAIQAEAMKVGAVLADEGVVGSFGIDFLVVHRHEVLLSEINLRMGGTTHPYWMARLATGGVYDETSGELRVGAGPAYEGEARAYVASDNLKSASLTGRSPAEIIATVEEAGLAFDPGTKTGTTLHLLGALREFGKMGITCIAPSPAEADLLYDDAVKLLAPDSLAADS